jgi:hypothetical protein
MKELQTVNNNSQKYIELCRDKMYNDLKAAVRMRPVAGRNAYARCAAKEKAAAYQICGWRFGKRQVSINSN